MAAAWTRPLGLPSPEHAIATGACALPGERLGPVIVMCRRINVVLRSNPAVVRWNYRIMSPGHPGRKQVRYDESMAPGCGHGDAGLNGASADDAELAWDSIGASVDAAAQIVPLGRPLRPIWTCSRDIYCVLVEELVDSHLLSPYQKQYKSR
jgi:hypothetical protein